MSERENCKHTDRQPSQKVANGHYFWVCGVCDVPLLPEGLINIERNKRKHLEEHLKKAHARIAGLEQRIATDNVRWPKLVDELKARIAQLEQENV